MDQDNSKIAIAASVSVGPQQSWTMLTDEALRVNATEGEMVKQVRYSAIINIAKITHKFANPKNC